MERLEDLRTIADQTMGGLTAGPELKEHILQAAAVRRKPLMNSRRLTALIGSCAVVLGLVFGLPALQSPAADVQSPLIYAQPAGNEAVSSVNSSALLGMNFSDVTIRSSAKSPAYRSIWAAASDGSFPLVCVDGRYYRLLTEAVSVTDTMLGSSLGAVTRFTSEPSLAGTRGVISNIVPAGETVYALSGMDTSVVTAPVDGILRVFQRVSFNGSALRDTETLADTLEISGHVTAMELSGVGSVVDSRVCGSLLDTLLTNASYESSGSVSGKQSLLIALDNGVTLQLAVKNDKLAGCGVWSCPEFIEAFTAAVR